MNKNKVADTTALHGLSHSRTCSEKQREREREREGFYQSTWKWQPAFTETVSKNGNHLLLRNVVSEVQIQLILNMWKALGRFGLKVGVLIY